LAALNSSGERESRVTTRLSPKHLQTAGVATIIEYVSYLFTPRLYPLYLLLLPPPALSFMTAHRGRIRAYAPTSSPALRIINPAMLSAVTLYARVRRANRIGDARFSFHHPRCPPVAVRKRFAIARTVRACVRACVRRCTRADAAIIAISSMTTRFPSRRSTKRGQREREREREEVDKRKITY